MRQPTDIIDNVRGGADALLHLLFNFPIFQSVMDIANYRSKYETAYYNAISADSDIPETIDTHELLQSRLENIKSNTKLYDKILETVQLHQLNEQELSAIKSESKDGGLTTQHPDSVKLGSSGNPEKKISSSFHLLFPPPEASGAASEKKEEPNLPPPIDYLLDPNHPNYGQFLINIAEIFELCKNDTALVFAILESISSPALPTDHLSSAIKRALHLRWETIDKFVITGYRKISGLILQDEKSAEDISQIIFNLIDQVVNLHVTINHNCFLRPLPTSAVQSMTNFNEQYLVQMLLLVAKSSNKELAADLKSFTHKILKYNKSQLLALGTKLEGLESTLKDLINNPGESSSLKTMLSNIEKSHSVILDQYLDAFQADHEKTSKNAFLKFVFEQKTEDPAQPVKELLKNWYETKVTARPKEIEQFDQLLTTSSEPPVTLNWLRDYPDDTTTANLKQEYVSYLFTFIKHDIALLGTVSLGDFISNSPGEDRALLSDKMAEWKDQIKKDIKRSSEPQESPTGNERKREAPLGVIKEENPSAKLAQQLEEHTKALSDAVHKYQPTTDKEHLTLEQAQDALQHLSRAQHSAHSTVFATALHLGATPADINLDMVVNLITLLTEKTGDDTPPLNEIICEAIDDLKDNKESINTTHQAQAHLITRYAKRISNSLKPGTHDDKDVCAKIIFFLKERLIAKNQAGELTFNKRWKGDQTIPEPERIKEKDIPSSFYRTKLAVTEYLSPDASFQSIISRLKPDSPQIADVISTLSEHADSEGIELSEQERQAFTQIHPNAFTQLELIYNLGIRWLFENDCESTPSDSIGTAVALKKFLTQRAEDARQATENLSLQKLKKCIRQNWSTSKQSFNVQGFAADIIGQEKIKKFDDRYYRATPSAANNFMILTIAAVVFFATAIPTVVILWETGTLTLTPALAVGSLIGSSILLATHHLINFFKKISGLDAVIGDIDALHSQFIPAGKQQSILLNKHSAPRPHTPPTHTKAEPNL